MSGDAKKTFGSSMTSGATRVVRFGLAAGLLAVALALVSGARAEVNAPGLTLGTITIGDGTVVVTGAVEDMNALLEINGLPIDIDESGEFLAVVDLDADALVLALVNAPSETVTIKIPIDVLLENGGDGILNDLIDAGVAVDVPSEGFKIVDGEWPLVNGEVENDLKLASLTINGVQVLDNLGPFGDFSIQLPRSSHPHDHVTVVVIDRRGVSQTSTFRATRVTSVIRTRAGLSVSASGARGVVIANVRFDKRYLQKTRRLGVIVTVKDRRGFLIRGAALNLKGTPLRYLTNGSVRAGFTNRLGKAKFTYRLHPRAFGLATSRHLRLVTRATTPTAAAKKTTMLRLPVLTHH